MLVEIHKGILGKLSVLEDSVSQRNFQNIDNEVDRLDRITKKMEDYLLKTRRGEGEAAVDLRLQRLRELTPLIDQIRKEKVNRNKSDREVAEEPFAGSNRYKVQEVYNNLSKKGELQHQMRIKIEQFFQDKLSNYETCEFYSSAKLGQEITQMLSYIPH
jgi:hypothetical protein